MQFTKTEKDWSSFLGKKQQKGGMCCIMQKKTEVLKDYITQALLSLMENKDFHAISIKEITKKAGVNRSTYYRNFNSKNDIIKYYFDKLHNEYYIKSDISKITDVNTIYNLFNHYYKYKEELLLIHKNGLSYLILDSLNEIFKITTKEQVFSATYKLYFYAGGIFNILLLWLSNDMKNKARHISEFNSIIHSE